MRRRNRRRPGPQPEEHVPHHDTPCECGHRHAEHSMFGTCHGCSSCHDDDDPSAEHDHPYDKCVCTEFKAAPELGDDLTAFLSSHARLATL